MAKKQNSVSLILSLKQWEALNEQIDIARDQMGDEGHSMNEMVVLQVDAGNNILISAHINYEWISSGDVSVSLDPIFAPKD